MSETNSEGIYETLENAGEMQPDDEILPVRKCSVLVQTTVYSISF